MGDKSPESVCLSVCLSVSALAATPNDPIFMWELTLIISQTSLMVKVKGQGHQVMKCDFLDRILVVNHIACDNI